MWRKTRFIIISQSLANSLASFFHRKIVSLKDSIALKLHGSPTPFDFDLPHSGEVLSDFTLVTPAEVSQLFRSIPNKSSPLDYIQTSLLKSCADTFSILISHLANISFTQATFPSKKSISPLLKNLVYQNRISQISDQYPIWIPSAKSSSVLLLHVRFFLTFQNRHFMRPSKFGPEFSRKRYEIERKSQQKLDRKSCIDFRMARRLLTLGDL